MGAGVVCTYLGLVIGAPGSMTWRLHGVGANAKGAARVLGRIGILILTRGFDLSGIDNWIDIFSLSWGH